STRGHNLVEPTRRSSPSSAPPMAPCRAYRPARRRTGFAFGDTGIAPAFFACAIFSATAFGGRPGPPGRHVPRVLRRRRRPFVAFGFVPETLPSSDWIAERTSP